MMDTQKRGGRRAVAAFTAAVAAAASVTLGALATPTAAFAQTVAGSLAGRITSADGTPLPAATVTVLGATGTLHVRSAAGGRFALDGLRAGTYTVRVEAAGFESVSGRAARIEAGAVTELDVALARAANSLVTIGRVTSSGGEALSTSSAPATELDPQAFAAEGYTRLSDVLQNDIATTLVHPVGGNTALPTVVALRGPDPTETLIDVDGHQVNSGNTGSFDLSLLDPADYGSVEIVRGISPSSLVGPDTIDGAINIRTIEPTATPHGLMRFSIGSFATYGETLQSTGTASRLGYALSLHRTTTAGEVNQDVFDVGSGSLQHVGSALDGSTALAKLRYSFGRGDAYVGLTFHDQSQYRDLSAALTSLPQSSGPASEGAASAGAPQDVNAFAGSSLQAHNAAFALDAQAPLAAPGPSGIVATTALYRHYSGLVAQSVFGPASGSSQYLYDDRDLVGEDSLQLEHHFERALLTLQYGVREELLHTVLPSGTVTDQSIARAVHASSLTDTSANVAASALDLAQTQRTAALRYTYDPSAALHVALATYYSSYSIFGSSVDPRLGLTWTPNARSAVRLSAGSTFQAPQLPELVVPAIAPAPIGGYVHVGNANLKPDRATEYELGFEQILAAGANRTALDVELYRVNLRTPAATYLPAPVPGCGVNENAPACPLTYPINAGDAVYRGIELAASRQVAPFTLLRAGYAARSAFLSNVPPYAQTGSLVVGEQTLGLPLQKSLLSIDRNPPAGWTASARLLAEGAFNELNRPQFATLDASVGYRFSHLDVRLSGSNLTNVYDQRFTQQGAGVPYAGIAGPLPTDAYALGGTALTLSVAQRF